MPPLRRTTQRKGCLAALFAGLKPGARQLGKALKENNNFLSRRKRRGR